MKVCLIRRKGYHLGIFYVRRGRLPFSSQILTSIHRPAIWLEVISPQTQLPTVASYYCYVLYLSLPLSLSPAFSLCVCGEGRSSKQHFAMRRSQQIFQFGSEKREVMWVPGTEILCYSNKRLTSSWAELHLFRSYFLLEKCQPCKYDLVCTMAIFCNSYEVYG